MIANFMKECFNTGSMWHLYDLCCVIIFNVIIGLHQVFCSLVDWWPPSDDVQIEICLAKRQRSSDLCHSPSAYFRMHPSGPAHAVYVKAQYLLVIIDLFPEQIQYTACSKGINADFVPTSFFAQALLLMS